jgi:type I restriction enzyme S subunit
MKYLITLFVLAQLAIYARYTEAQVTNWDSSPMNYQNSTMNFDNSSMNFQNSPMNFQNSPMNYNSTNDFRFKAKSSAMKMLVPKVESLSLKFAFFYLQTLNFVPKEHARHWIGTFAKMQMPLPALEDQLKIVEQLDNFEALVGSLSVGLPAELNARRKQYEYYRGKLLTFKEWES